MQDDTPPTNVPVLRNMSETVKYLGICVILRNTEEYVGYCGILRDMWDTVEY